MIRKTWMRLQRLRWPARWATKWSFVLAVTFLALYPHPALFVRNIQHWRNMDSLIDPDSPAIAEWAREFHALLPPNASGKDRLRLVDPFVRDKIPYAYDWVTWGVADYLPTLEELVAMGREDCDGRALVAASLIRRYDPQTHMATDFKHMWITSTDGDALRPSGPKVLEATATGFRLDLWKLVEITGPAAAIALFPFMRELIIAAALWLALCDPRMRGRAAVVGIILTINGLLTIRLAAHDPWEMIHWGVWLGFAQLAAALGVGVVATRRAMRRTTYP